MSYPVNPPRRLHSVAERTQILDNALASRRPVSLYPGSGPRVKRSHTSAEIMYDTPVTDPRMILLDLLLSVLFCGFWLPVWFYKTFRAPKIDYVTINEYGEQVWTKASISPAQRVMSLVVGIVLLFWAITLFNAIGELASITNSHPRSR